MVKGVPRPDSLPPLAECLATQVLTSIAAFRAERLLWGRTLHARAVRRRRFPRATFYGSPLLRLKGGFLAHRHPHPELATVLRGRLFVGLGAQVYRARAGDWCFFPPDTPHGECCAGGGYQLLWFIPDAAGLAIHVTSYSRKHGYRVTSRTSFRDISGEQLRHFRALCADPGGPTARHRARLLRITAWCVGQLEEQNARAPEALHPQVQAARALLEESVSDPPSVHDLAREVGVSPNYLSGLFHRQCGMTIRRFVEERRIAAACAYLRQSSQSIKEIAYALHFADPQHFSHLFRRIVGVSPSAYRGQVVEIQTPNR
jgi:AraC-like DNA-binding protein